MLFDDWLSVGRVLIVGALAYVALVAFLRISGKRTLSKMNAFDLVVTVALGSTLATVLLSRDVALIEGLTAFALLIAAQYLVAWLSVRSAAARRFFKSEPSLLFHRGRFLEGASMQERVTEAEVRAAMRAAGFASTAAVEAVVLETDGTFSVLGRPENGQASTLEGVQHTTEIASAGSGGEGGG